MMTFQIVQFLNLLHLHAKSAYISLAVRSNYYQEELVEMRSCQVALIVNNTSLNRVMSHTPELKATVCTWNQNPLFYSLLLFLF